MRLLYFHAPWCSVCHAKAPVVEETARDLALPLERLDIDTEAGGQRARELRVHTVPTLALLDGTRVRFRLVGRMITPEQVARLLEATRAARRDD